MPRRRDAVRTGGNRWILAAAILAMAGAVAAYYAWQGERGAGRLRSI